MKAYEITLLSVCLYIFPQFLKAGIEEPCMSLCICPPLIFSRQRLGKRNVVRVVFYTVRVVSKESRVSPKLPVLILLYAFSSLGCIASNDKTSG
jgi:hypothetical protein